MPESDLYINYNVYKRGRFMKEKIQQLLKQIEKDSKLQISICALIIKLC